MQRLVARDPIVGAAALALYRLAGRSAGPLVKVGLQWRARRGKEDPARRGERLGIAGTPRPGGPLVWVHAASVGEMLAVLPLIGRLTDETAVLLTTGTMTSARIATDLLPPGAIHQYAPVDTPQAVAGFLRYWSPDLALFVESELWPSVLEELRRRSVPLVLVNARLSDRSFSTWRRFAPVAAALMNRVGACLAQSETDAARLRTLGAAKVVVCGNLKFDVPPPAADNLQLDLLRAVLAGRPVLLAASTHPGEHEAVVSAYLSARRSGTDVLTIIAPRHPVTGPALSAQVAQAGLRSARRSEGQSISAETEIYIADTIGEMGLWYRLADMVILGGSLIRHGGQNPIEAAKLGVPILHGPHVGNFAEIYAALDRSGAARLFTDKGALAATVLELLQDSGERQRLAAAARDCLPAFAGALDRTMTELRPYLAKIRDGNGPA